LRRNIIYFNLINW